MRKGVSKRELVRYLCVRAGNASRVDSGGRPVSPPAAVGFSDEDQAWWSEGERIEALEQVDLDVAETWETSGSHRVAASGRGRRAASRVAKPQRLLGMACAGLLLAGALLATAGFSGEAHQAPLSTQMAVARVVGPPALGGRPAAAAADPMPAEIAAPPAARARHRARAKSKKISAPTVSRHAGGSKSRPVRSHPQ